jgi:hypothetical protein
MRFAGGSLASSPVCPVLPENSPGAPPGFKGRTGGHPRRPAKGNEVASGFIPNECQWGICPWRRDVLSTGSRMRFQRSDLIVGHCRKVQDPSRARRAAEPSTASRSKSACPLRCVPLNEVLPHRPRPLRPGASGGHQPGDWTGLRTRF